MTLTSLVGWWCYKKHKNNAFLLFVSWILLSRHDSVRVQVVSAGWVDPDTKVKFRTTDAHTKFDRRQYELVFSDEFEVEGREFRDGYDPRWTSLDKNDYTNDALHYYSSDNVQTTNGVLNITTNRRENTFLAFDEKKKTFKPETKHIQSAMVQGWNKFCFTGGIVEFRAKLPGKALVGGLWPALWLLGNLARATYVGSSDYMWPWSYNQCNEQTRYSQEIDACSKLQHYDMKPYQGRGAPEIDVLEAMGGPKGPLPNTPIQRPYFSSSLQIAPGVRKHRPMLGQQPEKGRWYEGFEYGNVTKAAPNPFFYGVTLLHEPKSYTYQSDALSANMHINHSHYNDFHVYRVEWEPSDDDGVGGYIRWFADGELVYGIDASVLNYTGTQIPNEPMYILMNTAVASSWGFPMPCPYDCDCTCFECDNPDCDCGLPEDFCENFPSFFEIDYVRVYQALNHSLHEVGCSTERRPSETFIKGNAKRYMTKGDRRPLRSVKRGGAFCRLDDYCGGGNCSKRSRCVCNIGYTGPRCLAYDAFDDHPYHKLGRPITLRPMFVPRGLLVLALLFFSGLFVAVSTELMSKRKYQRGISRSMSEAHMPGTPMRSPPSRANSFRANQKVVTYCMIDGRLIDD